GRPCEGAARLPSLFCDTKCVTRSVLNRIVPQVYFFATAAKMELVAVPAGLEPATFGLGNRCSIRLSYGTCSCSALGSLNFPAPGCSARERQLSKRGGVWQRLFVRCSLGTNRALAPSAGAIVESRLPSK